MENLITEDMLIWYYGRPPVIQDLVNRVPFWWRYIIKDTGQKCVIYSYFEDGTVSVRVFPDSFRLGEYRVFGIKPEDLCIE